MSARRRRQGGYGLLAYAVLYLAFLYVPVMFLPLFSFNDSAFIAFPLTGFTTRWYGEMLADTAMHTALLNSLKVGAAVSLFSTFLGLLGARALSRAGRRPRSRRHLAAAAHSGDRARHLAAHPAQCGVDSALALQCDGRTCAGLRAVR